jgi:hypothetical protein
MQKLVSIIMTFSVEIEIAGGEEEEYCYISNQN